MESSRPHLPILPLLLPVSAGLSSPFLILLRSRSMRVAQPPHRSSSSFFFSRWRDGIGRASMVSAVDAPRRGESTSSPGASGTKQSDGVQSGCTPWMAALFSGPPLILVGRQLRPLSSSARAMRDVPFILQLGSSPCIGLERCHSLEAGPSGGLSPTSSSSSSLAFPCLLHTCSQLHRALLKTGLEHIWT